MAGHCRGKLTTANLVDTPCIDEGRIYSWTPELGIQGDGVVAGGECDPIRPSTIGGPG